MIFDKRFEIQSFVLGSKKVGFEPRKGNGIVRKDTEQPFRIVVVYWEKCIFAQKLRYGYEQNVYNDKARCR